MPTPLQPGDRVELDITDIAFGGDGIGRTDGFVVFVPFVIAGERVEVQIVDVRKRFALADLVRVINPAAQRVAPRCPYYARCAGCQYQHIDYPHQLELKRKQIIDIFERIGKLPQPPIAPVIASPKPYHYRNKIVVHGPGKPGFWTIRGESIIAIDQCPIASEEINAKLKEVSATFLDQAPHLTLRSNSEGRVWTYTETRGPAPADDLESEETPSESCPPDPLAVGGRASPRAVSASTVSQISARGDARPPSITEAILGKQLSVPLGSFFQVNRGVIELALEHVRQLFRASGCKVVVDAYCGVGLFALLLADLATHVYGIEIDARATDAATKNAEALGLKNTDFYPGKTERLLFYTLRQCQLDDTCLILDPPRSGCGKLVLKTLRSQKPRTIIYVSCAPPMLARDIKALSAMGYTLQNVTPFDMFPQTGHCEAVAVLERA